MDEALKEFPPVTFPRPEPIDPNLKPILRGKLGGTSYVIDTATGMPATDQTPPERRQEVVVPEYHSILYWVDKDNPTGPIPFNPSSDPQFRNWEYAVQAWVAANSFQQQHINPVPFNPGGYSTSTGLPL